MSKVTPKTLPGFMELLPQDQMVFNKMVEKIRRNFELFGYAPLDTPIIESAEILLAKTEGETSRQIYSFTKGDNELALRFDLTVPLAKYVSLYMNDLTFPFKRYQIGKVYRGEKPQRGRFREFYQCDIDILDKNSLSLRADAEIVATIYKTFEDLGIGDFLVKINNRKVLIGLINEFKLEGSADKALRVIDKLDKVGVDKTKESLGDLGMEAGNATKLMSFIGINGSPVEVIKQLKALDINEETFLTGVKELEELSTYLEDLKVPANYWTIDLSIARGLDYYTGTVYETILVDYPKIGAICSGGRYDDLAEYYTDQKLPGVGISIGLTRLFYKLQEAEIIKSEQKTPTEVLIIPMNDEFDVAFTTSAEMRGAGIPTQVYLGNESDFRKKISYANDLGVAWIIIIGENEVKSGKLTLKNMGTGEQSILTSAEIVEMIKAN